MNTERIRGLYSGLLKQAEKKKNKGMSNGTSAAVGAATGGLGGAMIGSELGLEDAVQARADLIYRATREASKASLQRAGITPRFGIPPTLETAEKVPFYYRHPLTGGRRAAIANALDPTSKMTERALTAAKITPKTVRGGLLGAGAGALSLLLLNCALTPPANKK